MREKKYYNFYDIITTIFDMCQKKKIETSVIESDFFYYKSFTFQKILIFFL